MKKNQIKVSVIMPVYNAEKYIKKALDSLLVQTLEDIEIICVDDNSEDSSFAILKEYERKNKKIKVFQNSVPSDGAGMARNIGMQHAEGEYLSFLDADDFFEPDMLAQAYAEAVRTKTDLVIFDGYSYDEQTGTDALSAFVFTKYLPDNTFVFQTEELKDRLFQIPKGCAWNILFSSMLIKENALTFESIHLSDDVTFVYAAFACSTAFAYLPKRLIHYRVNLTGSQTAKGVKYPEVGYMPMLALKRRLLEKGLYEKYKVSFVNIALKFAVYTLDYMKEMDDFRLLYQALKNTYLHQLDAFSIPDSRIEEPYYLRTRNDIRNLTIEEYLWKRLKMQCGTLDYFYALQYEHNIPKQFNRIALYGAGKVGRAIYSYLLHAGFCDICGWFDRNYKELGYPLQNPQLLSETDCDCILVTIEDRRIFFSVKKALRSSGIAEDKIYWIGEDKNESCNRTGIS